MSAESATASEGASGPMGKPLTGLSLWLAGILLALANFVAILDVSIANVSVPNIAGALGVSTSQGTWVITSYAVAEAITVPLTGWLAMRFGTVRVFTMALLGFAATSFMCGISPNLESLLLFRVLQGVCGGPLMPLSQTLLLTIFPKKLQPAAMAIWAITTLVAPVAGPVLGGTLCDTFGWGSIFIVNVPVALGAAFLVWRIISRYESQARKVPMDFVGLGLLIVWVGALQLMLDLGKEHDWFESPMIIALALTALIGFIFFLIWELTDANPVVDLKVFRHRGFSVGLIALAAMIGAFFAINVIGPLWLQNNLGWTATWAGNATGMVGVLAIFAAPLAATLMTRMDPRILVFCGVMWIATFTLLRSFSTMEMSFFEIALLIFFTGFGMPMFFLPLTTIALGSVNPEETAGASGLQNFVRTMAGAVATSFVATAWENGANKNHAELISAMGTSDAGVAALQTGGADHTTAVATFDQMINAQALMISTNQIMFGAAIVFAFCAFMALWLPKPAREVDTSAVH
jgi:MFS transporter, DHA2 family, multidrug resistance protein